MKPARRPVDLAQRLLPFQQAITLPARATYCVYTHAHKGEVFYIGHGRADRPFIRGQRNIIWHEFVAQIEAYEVAVVLWTDDQKHACREETRLIRQYQPVCNIVGGPALRRQPRWSATADSMIPPVLRVPAEMFFAVITLAIQTNRSYREQLSALVTSAMRTRGMLPPWDGVLSRDAALSLLRDALGYRGSQAPPAPHKRPA